MAKLIDEIKNSIVGMQTQMQSTYTNLANTKLVGMSYDQSVKITMSATGQFEDINFGARALNGGLEEFRWRMREALKDVNEKMQKATQSKTVELLQGMQIPEDIRQLDMVTEEEDETGSGGSAGSSEKGETGSGGSSSGEAASRG